MSKCVSRMWLAVLLPLALAASPVAAANQSSPDERVDALIGLLESQGMASGVVLLAIHGKVVLERAFGRASLEHDVPNGPETRFPVASVTKQFTAILALQLVEDGLFQLDTPIGRHLPELPPEARPAAGARLLALPQQGLASEEAEAAERV